MRSYYRTYLNFSYQQNSYLFDSEKVSARSMLFTTNQTLSIGKNVIYANIAYDHEDNRSRYVYFNSSVQAEGGTAYLLLNKISSSSAITYSSVAGWYQQAGIRQSFAGQLGSRMGLNVFIDARKNIQLYQPLLYGAFRGDISIYYRLNK